MENEKRFQVALEYIASKRGLVEYGSACLSMDYYDGVNSVIAAERALGIFPQDCHCDPKGRYAECPTHGEWPDTIGPQGS